MGGNGMPRILAIDGSYREHGITDQLVAAAVDGARAAGAEVEVVYLRDWPIEFCLNCRHCTQEPGEAPGECVQQDRMAELIARIEGADGYILASPTNDYTVTALFKRFTERLLVYAYWPWDRPAPRLRRPKPGKQALLLSSCAAPGWMGRLFYSTFRQLKLTARTVGARPYRSVSAGLVGMQQEPHLPERARRRAHALGRALARR